MGAEKLNKSNGVFLGAYNGMERHNNKNLIPRNPPGRLGQFLNPLQR